MERLNWFCDDCRQIAFSVVKYTDYIEEKCREVMDSARPEIERVRSESTRKIEILQEQFTKSVGEKEKINGRMQQQLEDTVRAHEKLNNPKRQVDNNDNNDMTRKPESQTTADSIREMEDRERIKGNIIVFNIPERTAATSEIHQDDDLEFLRELCDMLEVDWNFSNPIRLGKRVMKIVLYALEQEIKVCYKI